MTDKVALTIEVWKLDKALEGLESLKKLKDDLNGKKISINADIDTAKKEIASLNDQLQAAQKAGDKIKISHLNDDIKTWRNIQSSYNADLSEVNHQLQNNKRDIEVATAAYEKQQSVVDALRAAVEYREKAEAQAQAAAARYAQEQAKVTEEAKKSASAAEDDWKARAEATKEAVRHAAEVARLKAESEKAAQEAERAAKAEEDARYAAYYSSLEERNKADAVKMAAAEIMRQNEEARRTAQEEAEAAAEAQRLAEAAAAAEARFQAVLSVVDGIGNALSIASSAVGGVVGFGQGIWDSIDFAGGLFNFSFLDKAMDTITSMITQNLTGHLDKITSRYDIMSTFSQYMELMGISQTDADLAMSRINESILGLPIGLDEAMYRLRRYQMFMGDIGQATNFTIGIQRAIMAGGANEQMRNMAYNQIERLLTTGELTNKRQWMSLLNGLGVSVQFIAEQLGYADMNGKELAGALYTGKISADEFLGAISALGEGTSDAAQRLDQALDIYKGTIESWSSNIEFAFIRGGQNLLSAVNRGLTVNTNVSVVGYMEKFRNAVNDAFKSSISWVDENPEAFTANIASISNLLDSLEKFNIGRIATKGFGYISDFINAVASAINLLDTRKTENFIAFATTIAGPLASFAKVAGPLAIAEGVVQRVSKLDWEKVLGKIVSNMNRVADATEGFLNLFSDEQLTNILSFSVVYGPMLVKAFDMLASAAHGVRSAMEGMHNLWGATKGLRDAWSSMFTPGTWDIGKHGSVLGFTGTNIGLSTAVTLGAAAAAIGAVIAVIQRFNNQKLEARKVFNLDKLDEDIQQTQNLISSIQSTMDEHDAVLQKIESDATRAEELLNKIDALNEKVKSGDETSKPILSASVDQFNSLFPELQLNLDATTGALDSNSEAVARNAEAYAGAISKVREYNETSSYLETLNQQRAELRARISGLKAARDSYHDQIEQIMKDNGYFIPEGTAWYKELWTDMTTGVINFFDGTDASIKALGEAYVKADAEVAVAQTELDSLNLTMQQTNDALHEQEDAIGNNAEAANIMTDAANDAANAQNNLASASESVQAAFDAQSEAIDGLVEKYKELNEAAFDALHSALAGFEEIKPPDKDYDFGAVLEGNAGLMSDYYDATKYIANLMLGLEQNGIPDELAEQGLTLADAYAYLSDVLSNGDVYKTIGVAERAMGSMDTFYKDALTYTNSLENAASASSIASLAQLFATGDKDSVGYALLTGQIKLPELSAEDGESLAAWVNSLQEGQGLLEDIVNKYGYDPLTGAFGNVESADELEEALKAVNEFTAQYIGNGEDSGEDTVTATFAYLQQTVKELTEETLPQNGDAYDDLGEKVNNFKENSLAPLVSEQQEATKETDNHKQAVQDLAQMITDKNQTFIDFQGTISGIGEAASSAASEIDGMIRALQGAASVEMPSFNIPAMHNSIEAFEHKAVGGFVEGTYIGRDSVPTMLMPGEFVVRRKVAQALGRNFLQNLNSMNIPAAVESLMRGVHIPMGHGIVAYDNRRTYDNHATVNQNIVTNNPAFTYRRASRFVGAL